MSHLFSQSQIVIIFLYVCPFIIMPASAAQLLKRALVKVLLEVAALYNLSLAISRDSTDKQLEAAFRKVSLKAHPDKGGSVPDFQKLQDAREKWRAGKNNNNNGCAGRPAKPETQAEERGLGPIPGLTSVFRIVSLGVLLTYQRAADAEAWPAFCAWVAANLATWGVCYWCATLETCKHGGFHIHLAVQFRKPTERTLDAFFYQGLKPNASTNDLCGEGVCKRKLQQSLDRGFFYVFADKKGTVRDAQGKDSRVFRARSCDFCFSLEPSATVSYLFTT
jgi:hypothetical protein